MSLESIGKEKEAVAAPTEKGTEKPVTLEQRLEALATRTDLPPAERKQALESVLADIQQRREVLSSTVQNEKSELEATRERLGLPVQKPAGVDETLTEVPGPFSHDTTRLDAMKAVAEAEILKLETNTEGSAEGVETTKEGLVTMMSGVAHLLDQAEKRAQRGMDPFMDRSVFQSLKTNGTALEEMGRGKREWNEEEVERSLTELNDALGRMNTTVNSGQIIETPESLKEMFDANKELYLSAKSMRAEAGISERLQSTLATTESTTLRLGEFYAEKNDMMQRYLRR